MSATPSPVRVDLRELIALGEAARALALRPGRVPSPQADGYRSPFRGRGMEFDESRPYQAGDDMRTLDWRVTARTGRPHTKLFREERDRSLLCWLDLRPNMLFATRGAYKAVLAARAAALLAWAGHRQGDRLGGLLFGAADHRELRPRRGKHAVLQLLDAMADHPAWRATAATAPTGLEAPLLRLRRVAHPGSLLFLLSDFRGLDPAAEAHLVQLARHSDVALLFFHDSLERELPPPGRYRAGDGRRLLAFDSADPAARQHHRERFEQHRARLEQLCRRHAMRLIDCATDQPLLPALQRGLSGAAPTPA